MEGIFVKKLLLMMALSMVPIAAMEKEFSSDSGVDADDESSSTFSEEHSDTWQELTWRQKLAAARRATLASSGNAFRLRRRRSEQMKEQEQPSKGCCFSFLRRKK